MSNIDYHYTNYPIKCVHCNRTLAKGEFYYGHVSSSLNNKEPDDIPFEIQQTRYIACLKCKEGERYFNIPATTRITGIPQSTLRNWIGTNKIDYARRNRSTHMIPISWILDNRVKKK